VNPVVSAHIASVLTVQAQDAQDAFNRLRLKKEMAFERKFVEAGGVLMAGCDPTGDRHVIAGLGDQRNIELLSKAGFGISDVIRLPLRMELHIWVWAIASAALPSGNRPIWCARR